MEKFRLMICPSSETEEQFDAMTWDQANKNLGKYPMNSIDYLSFDTEEQRTCFLQGYAAAIGFNGNGSYKTLDEQLFDYKCTSEAIWASFDSGQVWAVDRGEALCKAREILTYNLGLVKDALDGSDNCSSKEFAINMDLNQIEITPVKQRP